MNISQDLNFAHNPYRRIAMQDDAEYMYMMDMYPEACQSIYRRSSEEIMRRENMGQLRDDAYPSRSVIDDMTNSIYNRCSYELLGDIDSIRQFYGDSRDVLRDLVAVILLAELFSRRRQRRRRFYTGF